MSGCDLVPNPQTDALTQRGATVHVGHDEQHLLEVSKVVFTGPAGSSREVAAAREQGLPVLRRGELLGALMDGSRGIAVSGTHGKTTTTSLVASMLLAGGGDPSVLVGGVPAGWQFGGRGGRGEWFVAEADEYDRSFLTLHPEVAVVTGIEMDHPDIYRDVGDLEDGFAAFLGGMREGGRIFACESSDRGVRVARHAAQGSRAMVETYGLSESSDWRAVVLEREPGRTWFEVRHSGGVLSDLATVLPGSYNLENVAGALAAACAAGASPEGIREGLAGFRGVARRFELKGEVGGVVVVDDYAHHPAAVEVAVRAARERYGDREIWVAFQPHTYSRTREMMHEFAAALRSADEAFVLDVYAAREQPDPEVSGARLADVAGARHAGNVQEAADLLSRELRPGVLLLTMGAGDVTALGPRVISLLSGGKAP